MSRRTAITIANYYFKCIERLNLNCSLLLSSSSSSHWQNEIKSNKLLLVWSFFFFCSRWVFSLNSGTVEITNQKKNKQNRAHSIIRIQNHYQHNQYYCSLFCHFAFFPLKSNRMILRGESIPFLTINMQNIYKCDNKVRINYVFWYILHK